MPVSLRKKPTRTFPLGRVVATRAVADAMNDPAHAALYMVFLGRHASGDWGDLDPEDTAANDAALIHGGRLFSAYTLPDDAGRLWIITEADRSATTLLYPEEY